MATLNYSDLYGYICSTKGMLSIVAGVTAVVISRYLFRRGSVRKTWNKSYDFIIGKKNASNILLVHTV